MTELARVVITGVGLASPNGSSLPEFRQNLLHGVSGSGDHLYVAVPQVRQFEATQVVQAHELFRFAVEKRQRSRQRRRQVVPRPAR